MIADPVSLKFAIIVKFELGIRVHEAIFTPEMIGGVRSVDTVFASVMYCISDILRENSQLDPESVPVYARAPESKTPSLSTKSISVPVKPAGTLALG